MSAPNWLPIKVPLPQHGNTNQNSNAQRKERACTINKTITQSLFGTCRFIMLTYSVVNFSFQSKIGDLLPEKDLTQQ